MAEIVYGRNKSVAYFVDDWWACAWYRGYVPGVQLKRLGYEVLLDNDVKPEDVERFDVMVFQRKSQQDVLQAVQRAGQLGKMTVYDIDDDVWNLAPSNPGHQFWTIPENRTRAVQIIRAVDLVTTPTHALAERLRTFNPNVKVLPNMLPAEGWEYPGPKPQRADKVTLGWAGSTSHVEDLRILNEVVPQLLERYPQVDFAFVGGQPEATFGPPDRVRRFESTDIQHYPKSIENFDIGLIPLVDTVFNRSKSDLKFVEYSMTGIPSVASKLEPYLKSIKHGENGFLAANAKDWLKFLGRLIEHPELRTEIATRAQQFARTRTIDKGIDKWIRVYGLAEPPGPTGE